MPRLVRLYIVNVAIGFAIAAGFIGALLALDVAGLRHLVLETQGGWLAGGLIFLGSGTLFAGVQFAWAVMAMAERDDRPRGGRRQPVPVPVPVVVNTPRTTRPRRG